MSLDELVPDTFPESLPPEELANDPDALCVEGVLPRIAGQLTVFETYAAFEELRPTASEEVAAATVIEGLAEPAREVSPRAGGTATPGATERGTYDARTWRNDRESDDDWVWDDD